MRRVFIVLFVCTAFFSACGGGNENSAVPDKGYQPQKKEPLEPSTPQETRPAVRGQSVYTNSVPSQQFNDSEWKEWEGLTEEQHEEQVEKLSDRLDEIIDEYYEDDDAEELDRYMLLERLQEGLPEHVRDNLPEEVIEEIEWWTE